ncbi:MAG TPA: hypothetical protein C5S51_03460 [Methanosarcinaceae archaeon]|nr:hypothetical protein [Methanosarcinaceae archaeon]
MITGLLLNIIICFAITISSLTFAFVLARNGGEHSEKSKPALWALVAFWTIVGATYLPTTIRMIAAYMGKPTIDTIMYNISAIPFAFISVPLVFFIMYVMIGNKNISKYVSFMFMIFGASYLGLFYSSGAIGPQVTELSSIFIVNSDIAIQIYLMGLFIFPTAMILGLLLLMFITSSITISIHRTVLPLVAISFVFDFILTDFITPVDTIQIASRVFVLVGTVQAFLAYFPQTVFNDRFCAKNNVETCETDENDKTEYEDNIDV